MSLKDTLHALVSKKQNNELAKKDELATALVASDFFPIVHAAEFNASQYKKIPFAGIMALGAAFSQIPASARTIVTSVTSKVSSSEPLFVQVNPKQVEGFMRYAKDGSTSGNIWQINQQGKEVIKGRMRYKPVDRPLSVTETTTTTVPFDPSSLVVAAALMRIEKKLSDVQETTNKILQFLTLKEQAKQRGNLETLIDILEEYKQNTNNAQLCTIRSHEVQTIRREAQQSILFYQEQVSLRLNEKQFLHSGQKTQVLLDSVLNEFCEYQLACYIYAFSSFLDVLLQKNFDQNTLNAEIAKMTSIADKYASLFSTCHAEIAAYQRSSINAQLRGSAGTLTKTLGRALGSVPMPHKDTLKKKLIQKGNAFGQQNKKQVLKVMERFKPLQNCQMLPFIDNLQTVNTLYNEPNSMMMDSENLYILESSNNAC